MITYNQNFYKGEEIVYSITSLPEITTDTFSISSVTSDTNLSVRIINNHSFGVTCNESSNTQKSFTLIIDITNSAISKSETRQFIILWNGTYLESDKTVSTYSKSNLFLPVVLQNIGTYNIIDDGNGNLSIQGATVVDPETDGIIQGYRLSEFNDYDLETSTDKNDAAEHYQGKGIASFIQNPSYATWGTQNGWVNDGGTLKLPWSYIRNQGGNAFGLNEIESYSGGFVPCMISDPAASYVQYPGFAQGDLEPNMPAQFIGWKTEIAEDVWLYFPQGKLEGAEYEDSTIKDTDYTKIKIGFRNPSGTYGVYDIKGSSTEANISIMDVSIGTVAVTSASSSTLTSGGYIQSDSSIGSTPCNHFLDENGTTWVTLNNVNEHTIRKSIQGRTLYLYVKAFAKDGVGLPLTSTTSITLPNNIAGQECTLVYDFDPTVTNWFTLNQSLSSVATTNPSYSTMVFKDENGNTIPNTASISNYLETGNFIIKSTKNITKIKIWADSNTHSYDELYLAANKGNITFTQTTGSKGLYIWTGRSKHIKFMGATVNFYGWDAPPQNNFGWMGDIHSYTSNNQTTTITTNSTPRAFQNPKVYLIDQENPTSHTNDQLYDGTIHKVWVSALTDYQGNYEFADKPFQYPNPATNNNSPIGVYLIQVETENNNS